MQNYNSKLKSVLVEFTGGSMKPVSFVREGREYEVERVTVEFERRDGGRRWLCFGVDTGGMVAELRMDAQSFQFEIFND